jgi:DNA-directed RNA polymerase subunit RPC12/RpoP
MFPNRFCLYKGERPQVACPYCDRWRLLERRMLRPHRTDDGKTRCPGSGQRIVIDEKPAEWLVWLHQAVTHAAVQRPTRVAA